MSWSGGGGSGVALLLSSCKARLILVMASPKASAAWTSP